MNKRIDDFLSNFNVKTQKQILDFCIKLSETKADVYIVMARKAACFIECLEELGLLSLDGFVTSDRVLENDGSWLNNKSVSIIDDTIVSGTTVYRTIERLKGLNVRSIQVNVMSVNEKWFREDLLFDEERGISLLQEPYSILKNHACISLCNDIVSAIASLPRPYDIDYPHIDNFTIDSQEFNKLDLNDNYEYYNVSSNMQEKQDISSITAMLSEKGLIHFEKDLGIEISAYAMIKLRFYLRKRERERTDYHVKIVPMVIFNGISFIGLDSLFIDICQQSDSDEVLRKNITTYSSKLRFVQFIIAYKLAEFWMRCYQNDIKQKPSMSLNYRNLSFLFNDSIAVLVKLLCQNKITFTNRKLNGEHRTPNRYETNIIGNDIMTIRARLTDQFINVYYKQEIPCRMIVKEKGKIVFSDSEYNELVRRLDRGITISELAQIADPQKEIRNCNSVVSLFLDGAIDAGVIVPIFQEANGFVFQAYRHGEDILFGITEELLISQMLFKFTEVSGRTDLPHIVAEKMIVLFVKIGLQLGLLKPYIYNFNDGNADPTQRILRIKSAPLGPVALAGRVQDFSKNSSQPYLSDERKSLWLTRILLGKKAMESAINGLYTVKPPVVDEMDPSKIRDVNTFATLFGEVYNSKIDTGICCDDKDFTKLSTCLLPEDTVSAIAEEIYLFLQYWSYADYSSPRTTYDESYKRLLAMRKSTSFVVINSAVMKYDAFMKQEALRIQNSVRFIRDTDQNTWENYFVNLKINSIDMVPDELKRVLNSEYCWILFVNVAVRAYELLLLNNLYIEYGRLTHNKQVSLQAKTANLEPILQQLIEINISDEFIQGQSIRSDIVKVVKTIFKCVQLKASVPVESFFTLRSVFESIEEISGGILENVASCIGKNGKVQEKSIFPNCLFVDFRDEDENAYNEKHNLVMTVFNMMEVEIIRANANNRNRDSSKATFIEQLPMQTVMSDQGIWFASRGNDAALHLTRLGMNIFYKCSIRFPIRVVIISNLHYTTAIKKSKGILALYYSGCFNQRVSSLLSVFSLKEISMNEIVVINEERVDTQECAYTYLEKPKGEAYYFKSRELRMQLPNCNGHEYIIRYYVPKDKVHDQIKAEVSKTDIQIGVITALPVEFATMKSMMSNTQELFFPNRGAGHRYLIGEMTSVQGRTHRIALCLLASTGNNVAAVYATLITMHFPHLTTIIMTGIAGGIPNPDIIDEHIRLGDIVVSGDKGIKQYDFVKETWNEIIPNYPPRQPSPSILEAVRLIFADEYVREYPWRKHLDKCLATMHGARPADNSDVLYSIVDDHVIVHPLDPLRSGYPRVFCGAIASSNTLLKNPKKRDTLRSEHKVLAVEEEGSGVADATWLSGSAGYFVVRGICDYCDSHKNDVWHLYAAAVAAAFTRSIIERMPVE